MATDTSAEGMGCLIGGDLMEKAGSVASQDEGQDLEDLNDSSLRRSTRVSALKAQEKLKIKENMEAMAAAAVLPPVVESGEAPAKKAKISHPDVLDQYHCSFGIKLMEDDVCLMSDESEVSSLNGDEIEEMRQVYEEEKSNAPTTEELKERNRQIKELQVTLRLEEAKLLMLKKMKMTQSVSRNDSTYKKAPTNNTGQAYKPAIAAPQLSKNSSRSANTSTNNRNGTKQQPNPISTENQQLLQRLAASNLLTPQMKAQLQSYVQDSVESGENGSAKTQAIMAALRCMATSNSAKQTPAPTTQPSSSSNNRSSTTNPTPDSAQQALQALKHQSDNVNRRKLIREQLRRTIDSQLQSNIMAPKIPPYDLDFIPNPSAIDFTGLLGLDLVVQRVLKDKSVVTKANTPLYVCESCNTDCSSSWKAVGDNENDLKLACEKCRRKEVLTKNANDYNGHIKKVYEQIIIQEAEMERQIAAGKYDAAIPTPAPVQATPAPVASTSHATPASVPSSSNVTAQGSALNLSRGSTSKGHSGKTSNKRGAGQMASANNGGTNASSSNNTQNNQQQAMLQAAAAAMAMNPGSQNMIQQQLALMALTQAQQQRGGNNAALLQLLQGSQMNSQIMQQLTSGGNNNTTMQLMQAFVMQQQAAQQQAQQQQAQQQAQAAAAAAAAQRQAEKARIAQQQAQAREAAAAAQAAASSQASSSNLINNPQMTALLTQMLMNLTPQQMQSMQNASNQNNQQQQLQNAMIQQMLQTQIQSNKNKAGKNAPNYGGVYHNAAAIMDVDANLMCSLQVLKPTEMELSSRDGSKSVKDLPLSVSSENKKEQK
uniref:P66_CC domain-containing protein n=1 Tax=Rhabditophanes sp. KR3021 TaxID=114890 RepID=A0AC35TGW5_9BILA